MAKLTEVRLIDSVRVQYESAGGQRIDIELPRGTTLKISSDWIYNGVPASVVNTNDLMEGV